MKRALAVCLVLLGVAGCGYRPLRTTLPGGARNVRVALPNPARIDEPAVPHLLVGELCRQLGRAGIQASSAGRAESTLRTNLLALSGLDPLVGASGKTEARDLRLRLELVLEGSDGSTLWRSGLLEVDSAWPISPTDAIVSETSRRVVLERLAAAAARRAVDLLTAETER